MRAWLFLHVVVTAVVLNFPVTMPSKVAAHMRRAQRVVQAKDSCLIKRSAHHRGQVERPVALRVGTSWPKDWREVTWPMFPATPTDSMVAGTLGVRPPEGNVESTFPRSPAPTLTKVYIKGLNVGVSGVRFHVWPTRRRLY
jgi:hypothetical protein